MLRWMVVALLVLNALVFAWYRYGGMGAPIDGSLVPALRAEGGALSLLSASSDSSSRDKAVAVVSPEPVKPEADRSAVCGMFGAFPELISARQVRDRLRAIGLIADIVGVSVPLRTDYWVHLGPYASRDEALAQLKVLQDAGVDSFLINDGELANGISLGLFRQQGSAESLLKKRQAEGYEAAMREMPRTSEELWVLLEGGDLAESVRAQLLTVAPNIEYRKNLCGSIVSNKRFE